MKLTKLSENLYCTRHGNRVRLWRVVVGGTPRLMWEGAATTVTCTHARGHAMRGVVVRDLTPAPVVKGGFPVLHGWEVVA